MSNYLAICPLVLLLFSVALVHTANIRYVAANVGNIDVIKCAKEKLCDHFVAQHVSQLLSQYNPDLMLLSELCSEDQLENPYHSTCLCKSAFCKTMYHNLVTNYPNSSLLINSIRSSYQYTCSPAENGNHECVIFDSSKFLLKKSEFITFENCNQDFTVVKASLLFKPTNEVMDAIAVHPPSLTSKLIKWSCNLDKNVQKIWKFVNADRKTIIGGDWNKSHVSASIPPQFVSHFHSSEYPLDHCFGNFGAANVVNVTGVHGMDHPFMVIDVNF